uniref:hypothetical protein n=1 Tax=Candidatus Scatousia sp. TaxID=3085663 RepID=UPI0040255CA9
MVSQVSIKPGFGKRPDIPKTLSSKSSGGKNVTAAPSRLREQATQTVSTATVSQECRTRSARSSGNFVPGQRPIEYTRDRTVTVPHGAYAASGGKYQLESDMGMTKRSTQRLLKQQAEMQRQQQMSMLNQLNAMYGNNNVQPKTSWSDVITLVTTGLSSLFGSSGAEKGGGASKQSAMSVLNSVASQPSTASTISSADNSVELKAAIGEIKSQKTTLEQTLNSADYKNVEVNLQKAKDDKAGLDKSVAEQQGIVSNQQQTIDLLSNTRIPAQEVVVGNAEKALAQAKAAATSENPNTAAINSAQQALDQAKADLQKLNDQLKSATETRDAAKAKLDGSDGLLAKQKAAGDSISRFTALKNDKDSKTAQLGNLETTLDKAEAKEDKLIAKEEKKLSNMFDDIKDLDSEIANEKDASKRAELKKQYADLTGQFNELAGNTTSDRFANASLDGQNTISEKEQATRQSNLDKMRQLADADAQNRMENLTNKLRPKAPDIDKEA